MTIAAADLTEIKQAVSNVPNITVRDALYKMLDLLSAQCGGISDTITFATDTDITVVNGVITAATTA